MKLIVVTRYIYSVSRIPVNLHEGICYNKCLIREKGLYYHYDVIIMHCLVCLQNDVSQHVVNFLADSKLEPYLVTSFPPEIVSLAHRLMSDSAQ